MDGSKIKVQPQLGAAVVHTPTRTTIYIDAAGTEETCTIMRAELVVIHTALTTFASRDWIGIFTDSLSLLQAIRHNNTSPDTRGSLHYHHHILLIIGSITVLVETKRLARFHTTLHKIRAHTNIRGNDLVDTAAKLAVRNFDTLPSAQTIRVDIGKIAPRPEHWIMYTATPPIIDLALTTSTNRASFRRPWWTTRGSGPPENARLHAPVPRTPAQSQRHATT